MRLILAMVFAAALGLAIGWPGGIGGFIVGWTVGALISRPSKRRSNPATPSQRLGEEQRVLGAMVTAQRPLDRKSVELSITSTPARSAQVESTHLRAKPRLTWHASGQPLAVADVQINSGMVYMAERALEWPGEPSAIIPSLRVDRAAADPLEDFGYYPSYDRITPGQRRCYLDWLAAGRTDTDPACRALGHIFLFFYGLERRVVTEHDRDPTLLEEIIRLLQHYGPANRSRSLKSYLLQLLHFGGWQLGDEAYRALWPRLLEFDGDRADAEGLRFVLASLHQRGEPMDWSVGYRVALASEESRRSTVVSRAREKFWALFEQRFAEQYPEGIILKAAARPTLASYRPANSALLQMRWRLKDTDNLKVRLPDVSVLSRQFEGLPRIWNSCVDALSSYSRAVGSKRTGDAAALAKWQALPAELRQAEAHPVQRAFDELLAAMPREGEYVFVPAGTLAALAGVDERAKLTSAQAQQAAALAKGLGWYFAPDPAVTGLPLAWTQEIALYPAGSGESVTPHLRGIMRCLFLAVAVAAAHGEIEATEMNNFHGAIASQIQDEADWQVLRATEAALRRDPNVALRSMTQIAKAIPAESRSTVLGMMARIAAADGEVTLDELKILRRMARIFELDADAVDDLLHSDDAFREVVVEGVGRNRPLGEPIPQPGRTSPSFALDQDRINALTQETREVISLLAVVMAEPDEASVESTPAVAQPPASTDWLGELETRFHPALLALIERDEWTIDEFNGLAERHYLLPDDLFDSINTWSDEALGDFLLVKMATVRVFRLLLPVTG